MSDVFEDQVVFLLARIAEDEIHAQLAEPDWPNDPDLRTLDEHDVEGNAIVMNAGRLLAECKAKRGLVELAQSLVDLDTLDDTVLRPGQLDRGSIGATIVETLAEPYASHTDFDPAWRA